MNLNLCIQTGGFEGHFTKEETYRKMAEAGFASVDWNIDTAFNRAVMRDHFGEGLCIFEKSVPEMLAYYEKELDAIRAAGLYINQAHAPFPANQLDRPNYLDGCIEIYKNCILLCEAVGCRNLIIHPICSVPDKLPTEECARQNDRLYGSLIDTLKNTNVTVCLENLFYTMDGSIREGTCADARQAVQMIDCYNALAGKECFGLCVDTGHLNLLGKNIYDYITTVGKRIKAFHIHDNDGRGDLHLAPYTGNINWELFCRAVRDIGYDGDLSFETFRQVQLNRVADHKAAALWLTLIGEFGKLFREKIQAE